MTTLGQVGSQDRAGKVAEIAGGVKRDILTVYMLFTVHTSQYSTAQYSTARCGIVWYSILQ